MYWLQGALADDVKHLVRSLDGANRAWIKLP